MINFPVYLDSLVNVKDELELRETINTKYNSEILKSLNNLNPSNLEFIINLTNYLQANDKLLCKKILKEQFGSGAVGVVKKFMLGNNILVLKCIKNVKYNKKTILRINITHSLNEINNKYLCCFGDSFITQVCVNLILNQILKDNHNFTYQYDAYYMFNNKNNILKYNGYCITEYADLGDLSHFIETSIITDDLLMDIAKQILLTFSILKSNNYKFVHGDSKCKNILVKNSSTGPIFKLADFDKSSISWNGIRFFNGDKVDENIIEQDFIVENEYYKLNCWDDTRTRSMFSPKPIFMSYDVYTLIISMIREPKIFNFLICNKKSNFYKLIEILFDETDLQTILNHTQQKINKFNYLKSINNNDKADKILVYLRSIRRIVSNCHKLNIKFKIKIDNIYDLLKTA